MLVITTKKKCAPQAKFFSSREEKKISRAKIIQKVHDFKKNKKKFPDFPEISSSWDWKQMIFFWPDKYAPSPPADREKIDAAKLFISHT